MCFFKKRDENNEITVHLEKYADIFQACNSDALTYKIAIPYSLFKKRHNEEKDAMERFVLAADKKFCSDCYWYIYTENHYPYVYREGPISLKKMVETVSADHPYVSHIEVDHNDYFHAVVNNMNEKVFHMLEHFPSKYGPLKLNVFDVVFSAFYPSGENKWDELVEDLYIYSGNCDNTKVKLNIECSLSDGIAITFNPILQEDIKAFLIDIFTKNGLKFKFVDYSLGTVK